MAMGSLIDMLEKLLLLDLKQVSAEDNCRPQFWCMLNKNILFR